MNPIDELVQQLAKHPELTYKATATSVTIDAPTAEGFQVRLSASRHEYVVGFDGWHEHFTSAEEALNCVTFAYSGRCRVATTYRGRIPVKWVLEYLDGDLWVADSEVGHFFVPFWLRPRVMYRQNPKLLAYD